MNHVQEAPDSPESPDGPDRDHRRPPGVDDKTVEALGALSKALETTERARGSLYAFHQLTGGADLELDRAVRLLRDAGHPEWAEKVRAEILGRNVIPGTGRSRSSRPTTPPTTTPSSSWSRARWRSSHRAATTCTKRR